PRSRSGGGLAGRRPSLAPVARGGCTGASPRRWLAGTAGARGRCADPFDRALSPPLPAAAVAGRATARRGAPGRGGAPGADAGDDAFEHRGGSLRAGVVQHPLNEELAESTVFARLRSA